MPRRTQAYLRKLDVRAAAAKFDQAGLPLQAAEQLLDLAIAEAFWGRRGASLSTPTFDGAVSEDLNAALERLDSSAFPSFSNSHWGLRARCQALLIFLPAAATGGEHAPAARPLHRQMDDLWQTIESSRAARCNVILQAIAGPLAIRDLTMRLQALLGPPTAPPDHVADVLSALQGWIGRLSLSTAKLRYVLEAATKGQQPHLVEESELLDGCSALFGLAARPGSPMFLARPAALALLSSIGKDARFPWKNALSLMADGTQGVALADAAPLVLQELDAHVLQAVKVAEKAIENVLSALSVDEAWEGPQANTRPSPWAGICCHAAILQTPLVTLSARCEKNKQSRAASESLWRILMPLMWTAQDPSPLLQLLPRQRIPLSVSLGAALEELLRQDLYKQRPRAINPAWTLRNSIALLMSLPYADSTLLLGRLKQEVLPVAEAKYVPLVPAQVPEPATDDPSEDLAAYRIFQAIHCLQQCLASSPASSREADGETLSGQDEAPPLSRLRKLQFDTAWWMIGALHATFQVPHWLSCPGYPYPLHMLEAAEKAALVCCGVMKGWHKVLVPRRMAMQHLQPLEPLLSWSVSANILPKEKRTLEVREAGGIALSVG